MIEKIQLDESTEVRLQNVFHNGFWRFDIRIFWRKEKKGEFLPTQKGISLRLNRFFELHEAINRFYPKIELNFLEHDAAETEFDRVGENLRRMRLGKQILAKIPFRYNDLGYSEIWFIQNEDESIKAVIYQPGEDGAYHPCKKDIPLEKKHLKKMAELITDVKRSMNRIMAKLIVSNEDTTSTPK